MPIEMTMKDLSALVGYTYRRMQDINKELPEDKRLFVRGEGGKYLLDMFVQRWADYQVAKHAPAQGNLDALKAEHERVRIERAKTELERLRGELIDAQEVKATWCSLAARLRGRMLELPAHMAPLLVGQEDEQQIVDALDREVRSALTVLAQEDDGNDRT